MKRTRILILSAIVLLAGVFLFLSWQNSSALQAVSIRIKDGVKEHTDHTILGLGAEHRLPDYKVQLRISRKLMSIDLGTKLNVSATNWLEYPVNDLIPVRQLQEIIIVEDDKVENDLLERIQLTGETMEGATFHCRLTTTRSLELGINWFFGTPFGKSVVAGVVIGIIVLVFLILRR